MGWLTRCPRRLRRTRHAALTASRVHVLCVLQVPNRALRRRIEEHESDLDAMVEKVDTTT